MQPSADLAQEPKKLLGISSMATRQVLSDLAHDFQEKSGVHIAIESVGGVDAAKRVAAGENFDAVFLASDAIDKLIGSAHILAGSRVDLMRSSVAVAVQAGSKRYDISNGPALCQAVLDAKSVSYSTGPSGVALAQLFERWSISQEIAPRLITPPPGVAVGLLVARGEVQLGFQQLSELIHVKGIDILGPMPADVKIETIFSSGICTASRHWTQVRQLLEFMSGPQAEAAIRRQGMEPI